MPILLRARMAAVSRSGLIQPVMSGLLRYAFCSCLRLMRLGFGQFWPDQVPVIGAQFLAGDLSAGGALYGDAAIKRDRLFTACHF